MTTPQIALGLALGTVLGALAAACIHLARGYLDARRDGGAS